MTARRTFHFADYMLRPTDESDIPVAVEWTEADPEHRGLTAPVFWLEQGDKDDSYILLDRQGRVFFLKLHEIDPKTMEIHIQFAPTSTRREAARVGNALMTGLDWLETMLRRFGYRRLCFDSRSRSLIAFAIRKLHFSKTSDFRFEKSIAREA